MGLDPQPFLVADKLEAQVLNEVLKQAMNHLSERKANELEAMRIAVHNGVVSAFGG